MLLRLLCKPVYFKTALAIAFGLADAHGNDAFG
jgi:hypothetical protein